MYKAHLTLVTFCINRNILECKVRRRFKNFCTSSGINRNILECKDGKALRLRIIPVGINRNILECKVLETVSAMEMPLEVLIETYWNVKRYIEQNKDGEQKY